MQAALGNSNIVARHPSYQRITYDGRSIGCLGCILGGCLRKSSLSRWARIPYGPQSECTLPAGPEYLHTHVMSVQGLTKKIKSHTDIAGDHAPRPDKPPPLSERQLGSPSRKDTRNVSTPEHISAKRPRPRVYEPRYWPQPTCTRMVMSNENHFPLN